MRLVVEHEWNYCFQITSKIDNTSIDPVRVELHSFVHFAA